MSNKGINDILQYKMSACDNDFFSNMFFHKKVVKDILAYRYSEGEPKWLNHINEGRIYSSNILNKKSFRRIIQFRRGCIHHNFSNNEIVAYYCEKVRNNADCYIFYNNTMCVMGEMVDISNIEFEYINGIKRNENEFFNICISKSMVNLIYDLQKIDQYNEFYVDNKLFFHPVSLYSYKDRELFVKALLLFFIMNGGLNIKQIFHITSLFRCFEASSKTSENILEDIFYNKFNNMQSAFTIICDKICNNEQLRKYLLLDLLYLLEIGRYDCQKNFALKKVIGSIFNENINYIISISEKITKEI